MHFLSGKEAEWNKGLANNSDPYGSAIYRFARRWAELMEKRIDAGEKLEDIAKSTSHEANMEGITGFMYGAAVSLLSHWWIHGEALRKWNNLSLQIRDEGERANRTEGAVLNPALLTIGGHE